MDIYREHLLDHYHHPRHWGLVKQADYQQTGYNPFCGDKITLQLTFHQKMVTDIHFVGHGCVISIAAASLLSERASGERVPALLNLTIHDVEELLGFSVPPARLSCAELSLTTLHQALQQCPS